VSHQSQPSRHPKKGGEVRTEVLDKLLVLVELLKVIHGHELETGLLGLIAVEGVSENADGELGAGDVGELDAAGETLVLLGIVVLEADLELDSLSELLLVLLGVLEEAVDGLKENFAGNLAALRKKEIKKFKLISKKLPDRNFDLHLEEVGEGRGQRKGEVYLMAAGVCIWEGMKNERGRK